MDKDLKLREATNSFITKQYYDGTSGSIESYRRAFYEGAKSDAAKEYHQQSSDAVEFKIWCEINEWQLDNQEEYSHTPKELYSLFLNSKTTEG